MAFSLASPSFAAGSQVSVSSENSTGSTITGYYVVLFDSSGSVSGTGFTPTTFTTTASMTYGLQADSYGNCVFSKWSDGVTSNPRTLTATTGTLSFVAVYFCGSGTSVLTVNSQDTSGNTLNGFYTVLYQNGDAVETGFTPAHFNLTNGLPYQVLVEGYNNYYFQYWSGSNSVNSPDPVSITSSSSLTAVMCNGACSDGSTAPSPSGGVTVYASRIAASYWANCFAAVCSAGTGPGASMYFALEDGSGNVLQSGFSNEWGLTFTGLTPGTTYYLVAENCNLCHGSTHDVLFNYWTGGSLGTSQETADPLPVTAGTVVEAWYSCTNGCAGT